MRPLLLLALLALLSGCVLPDEAEQPHRVGPVQKTATNANFPGLVVDAVYTANGTLHTIEATARNHGPRTYHVSSICAPVWTDVVRTDAGERVWPPPQVVCLAFGTKPFPPHEHLSTSVTWEERAWDAQTEREGSAPKGAYEWTLTFHASKDAEGGLGPAATVTFPVHVN
jgi:hypothetical protein